MLDVTDRLNIEVLQFIQIIKGMVFGLFIRTEFECNWKGLSARLNGQIVCCLIVVLVLRRKPYRGTIIGESDRIGASVWLLYQDITNVRISSSVGLWLNSSSM